MGKKYKKRKRGAALGQNQGINGMQRLHPGQPAGERSTAQCGCNAPEERGGGDVKISPERLAMVAIQFGFADATLVIIGPRIRFRS